MDSEPASSLAAHAPIEIAREERRLVTALFCDLAGFTPLSERLDAEQIRSLQAEYFERMSGEIARFGGKVEKFAGDAVLALFGVPVTHGDDAERALLCSIAMQAAMGPLTSEARDRWEVDLALRIGVNTGEAVGGVLDIAGHKDYSVTGDVLNTAARLQSAAGPGSVMAGEETMRLARKSIRFGERRDLTLKGKGRPVAAYQVLGTRASPSERRNEQKAQLVGRDHELSNVIEAWTRAQSNEGQLVTVVGDAGVGKSSLIAEAAGIAAPADGAVYWARALSYGQDISLYLVGDLVRSMIGASDQEGPESVGHRLDETIETLLAGQPDDVRAAAIDALREVLSLDESRSSSPVEGAQARRQVLVKSLRLVLLGLSQQEAAIVVLDDLQWIDSASAEVLSEIMTDVPALRLCVLAAHHSGWTAPWAEWTWIE
ncbi:MAG: adenylate/guanylate cyclase domain-containing protein, partial [Stellaceae bacterium]